jgi:hypothetical protein
MGNSDNSKAQVIIPAGMDKPQEHEIDAAWILARHFNITVEFLVPVNTYGRKTPDIRMDGDEWEMKSPQGKASSTVQNQFKKAMKQSDWSAPGF